MDSLLSFPVGLFHPLQHAGCFIPAQGCPNRQVRIPSRDRILCPDNARDSGVIGFLKERLIMGSSLSCRHRPVSLFRPGEYNLAV
jgi:hypothetical protein